ncbi:hypothetical protein S40288_01070 [Stachybotrys chartarum IBT 40288]|nr:hypothetical protein S40288_01070 [Stachybotrys chartarum IBT 40288]
MSPPRRRSARLATSVKGKSKPELSSVSEYNETPSKLSRHSHLISSSPTEKPSTPESSAIKPPHSEMHPTKAHPTAGPSSPGLWLGFADLKRAGLNSTPSKGSTPQSSAFTFRVAREAADTQLSSDAQRMMDELREQAAIIKADLVAQREADGSNGDAQDRRIAKPKGKSGRFSAAHMAEFKKMDSIENHPSAWRAQNGRFTPVKSRLKRSPSKAELDGTPKSGSKYSPTKADATTPTTQMKSGVKRSSTMANLDMAMESPSPKKAVATMSPLKYHGNTEDVPLSTKRFRARLEDDASSARPASRDGSSIPQPKFGQLPRSHSTLSRLMSPTKASLGHIGSPGKPTVSLVPSPSREANLGSLKPSATTPNLVSPSRVAELKRRIISPRSFHKVKSILRGQKSTDADAKSAIPQRAALGSQTPAPVPSERLLPAGPLTTPRRKLSKHVSFSPDTNRIEELQKSPSPRKGGLFKTRSTSNFDEAPLPTMDAVLAEAATNDVVYPDLSSLQRRTQAKPPQSEKQETSAPGTFTFRSDHTIEFGVASAKFGASPGQSSIRHVRGSLSPSKMPGAFPDAGLGSSHPNKENKSPATSKLLFGVPHGMSNKKRHRAREEDDDLERHAKKRKNEDVPEGHIVLNARPVDAKVGDASKTLQKGKTFDRTPKKPLGRTPSRTPSRASSQTPVRATSSATPNTKKHVLSLSRLNMLARPKNRA